MYAFPYLSRLIATDMFSKLVAMMPPPIDPSPEGRRNRDIVAMCMLKQMGPIRTVEEASLAITIVAADAHAHDALRGAAENPGDFKAMMQCRAQASTMLRTRHKAAAALDALIRSYPVDAPQAETVSEAETQAAAEPTPSVQSTPIVEPSPRPVPLAQPTQVTRHARTPDRAMDPETNVLAPDVSARLLDPALVMPRVRELPFPQAA